MHFEILDGEERHGGNEEDGLRNEEWTGAKGGGRLSLRI
jgi:hypothetical protein